MIDVEHKKCCVCNTKQPNFNYLGESKATHCSNCKLDDMINVVHKKCKVCNNKLPIFNYSGEKIASHCGDCKLDNMIDVKHRKCSVCNIKRSNFNYSNEIRPTHCGDCKLDNMIDVKHRKCSVCNIKRSNFNYSNEIRPTHCNDCKLDDMINMVDIKRKKCIICNIKQPSFNLKELKPEYCRDCKTTNMINVKDKKCNYCNFNIANKKYKPNCATCHRFLNPNEQVFRNYKIKENTIMKFVKDKYPDIILDSIISGGCSKRRPDGLLEFDNFSIIIEIDEDSHRSYEDICENKRLMEIYKDLGFRPLRVIRFNPDSYVNLDNKKINSIFSIDKESKKLKVKNKKELDKRVQIILETIERIELEMLAKLGNKTHIKELDIEYLFFNEN